VLVGIIAFLLAATIKVNQEECTHCRSHSNHNSFNHLPTATFYAPADKHMTLSMRVTSAAMPDLFA